MVKRHTLLVKWPTLLVKRPTLLVKRLVFPCADFYEYACDTFQELTPPHTTTTTLLVKRPTLLVKRLVERLVKPPSTFQELTPYPPTHTLHTPPRALPI